LQTNQWGNVYVRVYVVVYLEYTTLVRSFGAADVFAGAVAGFARTQLTVSSNSSSSGASLLASYGSAYACNLYMLDPILQTRAADVTTVAV
jgi:hypothetical protein